MSARLNPEQQRAVETTEGPVLIFAGAGSGKTRVLVHRIAYMVQERGISPWQIFAVTFTNKAAGEMRERIERILGEGAKDVWISTFHSAGVRILRRHIEKLGYGKAFVIYDDSDQMTLIKKCLEELGLNPKIFSPRSVQSRIDAAKNELIQPKDFSQDDFFGERVAKVYELYQKKLIENNAVDFGDLLLLPVRLLEEHPQVLAEFRHRLRYLMVDEYQDTNHAQYRLIKLLAGERRNLCVVGDDDQSIYRWRGADIRNILEFEKDFPNCQVIKLEQNYRSTKNILAAAGEVVKAIAGRCEKTLWTDNDAGEKIVYFTGPTDKHEAQYVVAEIQKIREKMDLKLSEFAIFYRTNAQSRIFEDELRKQNMPYVIFGGVRFYDRMEIKDILAYLWVLANPADSLHLRRILNVPARGIGDVTVEKLEKLAAERGLSLLETLPFASEAGIASGTAKKIATFHQLIQTLKTYQTTEPLDHFVKTLMEQSGYIESLKAEQTIEAESRLENLEELVNVVADYMTSTEEPSLEAFLDQVALVSDLDQAADRSLSLPLMTLHLAKGLEFEVVFFVGMEEGILPHIRSFDTLEEMDEERRITYVGMTRAKKHLYLTNALKRRVFGNDQYNLPSRFLEDLPQDIVQRIEMPYESFGGRTAWNQDRDDDWDEAPASWASPKPIPRKEDPNNPYKIGAKVRHPIFGVGTIRDCEGNEDNRKITVAFSEVGQKKLIAKFSNLTILG